ncbi:MAG: ChaN family lipoprotein [Pyrinomonadaceae bacterium]
MKDLFCICLLLFTGIVLAHGQVPFSMDAISVFDSKGNPATIEQIIKAIGENEAVFLGEQHDDAVGHAVQMEIFKRAVDQYSADHKIALSLEMFERDVQVVVNEYLTGQITEAQFLASSRPWGNYKTDYRPLVELAKSKKLPVIAANAPRRYVNMVSRNGRTSLDGLTKEAKSWLPPLPYGEPSAAYATKFKALMGPSPEAQMGIDKILASQSLWDASMSNSVYRFLKDNKNPLVIHLNGGFHTESRLGTFEHLMRYRPKTKGIVVTMRYEDDFKTFDKAKHADLGDFVILTDGKQPRSKR